MGHAAGDFVLRGVGKILQEGVRKSDLPCRVGGDEFIILLADLDEPRPHACAPRALRTAIGSCAPGQRTRHPDHVDDGRHALSSGRDRRGAHASRRRGALCREARRAQPARLDSVSEIRFQIWGSRGGRNTYGSRIGNLTSCYSLRVGAELFVFDAGRGLLVLADAVLRGDETTSRGHARPRARHPRAHGSLGGPQGRGVDVEPEQRPRRRRDRSGRGARGDPRRHAPPSFVPLEVLAIDTLARFAFVELARGFDPRAARARPCAASRCTTTAGMTPDRRYLDTLGYHLVARRRPELAYLSDHEPTDATRAIEDELVSALAARGDRRELRRDRRARVRPRLGRVRGRARTPTPASLVLAAHHGPLRTDDAIEAMHRRYGCANLMYAVEGASLQWDEATRRFVQLNDYELRSASSLDRSYRLGSSRAPMNLSTAGGTAVKRSVHGLAAHHLRVEIAVDELARRPTSRA